VTPKIGRFCGPKKGRNSKHFHDDRRHTKDDFWTILAQLYHLIVLTIEYENTATSKLEDLTVKIETKCQ